MATTVIARPPIAVEAPQAHKSAIWGWLSTTDHKRIGQLYLYTSLTFFLLGGIEALIIRAQLFSPNGRLVSADVYNQIFTMHGTTMIFMALMPLSAVFF